MTGLVAPSPGKTVVASHGGGFLFYCETHMTDDIKNILQECGVGPLTTSREEAIFCAGMAYQASLAAFIINACYRDLSLLVQVAEQVRPQLPQLADLLTTIYQRLSRDCDQAANAMDDAESRMKATANKRVWGK